MEKAKTCSKCGEAKPLVHGRQCQDCRNQIARNRRRAKAATKPKPICEVCGCEFEKTGNNQKICNSDACKKAQMREFQADFRKTEKYSSWYADFYGTGLPPGAAKVAAAERAASMTPEEIRERYNKYAKKWRESNRHTFNAKAARRRAAVRDAIPPWLNDEHHAQIAEFYAEAQRLSEVTGIPHEVDHICPLVNDNICGLHVPWNLSVLPMADNRSKGNKIE